METGCGVLTEEEIRESPGWPGDENIEKRRVVVIECVEDIPCNPCENVCPVNAITVGEPITNLPSIDGEKCNGCGICIAICPGLAIFMIEKNYNDRNAAVSIPYELLPLPEEGEVVGAYNRHGVHVCDGVVRKVRQLKKFDRTVIVTIEVGKEFFNSIRSIQTKKAEVAQLE